MKQIAIVVVKDMCSSLTSIEDPKIEPRKEPCLPRLPGLGGRRPPFDIF